MCLRGWRNVDGHTRLSWAVENLESVKFCGVSPFAAMQHLIFAIFLSSAREIGEVFIKTTIARHNYDRITSPYGHHV